MVRNGRLIPDTDISKDESIEVLSINSVKLKVKKWEEK